MTCPRTKGKKCNCKKKKAKKRGIVLKMVGEEKNPANTSKTYTGIQRRPPMPDHPSLKFT